MPSGQKEPGTERDHERREADDGEVRRAAPVPAAGGAAGQGAGVDQPGHQREEGQRVERKDAAPRGARPHGAEDQARGEERKAERERAVCPAIERLEGRQAVIEAARALVADLTLLQQVHDRAREVEHEGRDAHERQRDMDPDPRVAERRRQRHRARHRRLETQDDDDRQHERAQHRDARLPLDQHLEQHDDPDDDRYGVGQRAERRTSDLDREHDERQRVGDPADQGREHGETMDVRLALDEVRQRQSHGADVSDDRDVL